MHFRLIYPFVDQPEVGVEVLFYPVPRGGPVIGTPTVFCMRNWDELEELDEPTLGTKYDVKERYYGEVPPIPPGTPSGTPEQWLGEIDYSTWLAGGYTNGCPTFTMPIPGYWFFRRDLAGPPSAVGQGLFGPWSVRAQEIGQYMLVPAPGKRSIDDWVTYDWPSPFGPVFDAAAQYFTSPLPAVTLPGGTWTLATCAEIRSGNVLDAEPCAALVHLNSSYGVKATYLFRHLTGHGIPPYPVGPQTFLQGLVVPPIVLAKGDRLCVELGAFVDSAFALAPSYALRLLDAGADVVSADDVPENQPGTWIGYASPVSQPAVLLESSPPAAYVLTETSGRILLE
jgi:hypothetical protein